jgi:hypothetical protein
MDAYSSRLIRSKVRAEWENNPRCAICGMITAIQQSGVSAAKDNTATYGHIYSVWDIRRFLFPNKWQLECYKCNNGKEKEENPSYEYKKVYMGNIKKFTDPYPELLIALAEEKDNEIYLTQIEFKTNT